MTLAQIAEKPMTVRTEETINSLADSRHGRPRLILPEWPFAGHVFSPSE